jgi:hypothetical protein
MILLKAAFDTFQAPQALEQQRRVWQVILAHFGSLLWPTLRNDGFRPGRKAGLA